MRRSMTVLTSSSHRAGQGVSQDHFGSLIHHMVLEITLGSHFRLCSHFSENSVSLEEKGSVRMAQTNSTLLTVSSLSPSSLPRQSQEYSSRGVTLPPIPLQLQDVSHSVLARVPLYFTDKNTLIRHVFGACSVVYPSIADSCRILKPALHALVSPRTMILGLGYYTVCRD